MSCNQTFKNVPYTGTSTTNYEVTVAADNSPPTEGDSSVANVTFAPQSGVNAAVNRRGPEEVNIKTRFTGTARATADVVVNLWLWDSDASQWHMLDGVAQGGVTTIAGSLTKSMAARVDTDPNARLGFLEVTGLIANQAAVMMVTKVK